VSAFIDQGRDRYGVEPVCETLGVSASAYYQRATGVRSARAVEDERLLERISEVHAANYHAYGYRRMWKALLRAGEQVPRCRVQRLMRDHGIQGAKRRGKPWQTTKPDPAAAKKPDLVCRDFTAGAPNRLWVGDLTYLRCWEGLVFFAFIIDVYSRMIVGWQLAANMRTTLVLDALRMALGLREPGADFELVAHTDAGSQYTSFDYTQVLSDHEVLQSIGTVGDALDNALAESFVDSYKTELIHDRVWRSRAQLELATVEYVGWFNNDRLHEALSDIPPIEFEQRHALAEPVDSLSSGNGSVAGVSPRSADGLRTPRFSALGVDLAADNPIDAINASAALSAQAQTARAVTRVPTLAAGLSDLRFREILADNNNTNHQTTQEPT
jgi:putative transposase